MKTTPPWKDRFRLLVETRVPQLTINGCKGIGLCPFHPERTPSFSVNFEEAVFHCFGCGVGGGVRKFAELLGEKWTHHQSESLAARADRVARARVRGDFRAWVWQNIFDLTDWHRELLAEREVAEIARRAVQRCPNLYSQKEKYYWATQRASLDAQLESLQRELDIFTDDRFLPERIARWALTQKIGQTI